MGKKIIFTLIILLLLLTGCEKKQEYFKGTVAEITNNYFIVIPDEDEPIKELGDKIFVPKEVISRDGIPDLTINERVQIVYNNTKKTDDGVKLDVVFAIYKESELLQQIVDSGTVDPNINTAETLLCYEQSHK